MVGFKIPYSQNTSYSGLICHTTVNGQEFSSKYFIQIHSESVVILATPALTEKLRRSLIKRFLFLTFSLYFLNFTALVLNNVKITPDRARVLVGDTLVLNCTGETTYNGRINFTWDFPKKRVSSGFTVKLYICM